MKIIWTEISTLGKGRNFHVIMVLIREDGEMAKKVIDRDNVTCQHMHSILIWLKIRTIHFSLIFISKYSRVFLLTFFISKILSWLKIRIVFASNPISFRIFSYLNIFEIKIKEKWMVRILSYLKIKCEASDVRDIYFRDQGVFGTKCKFATPGNNFVTCSWRPTNLSTYRFVTNYIFVTKWILVSRSYVPKLSRHEVTYRQIPQGEVRGSLVQTLE